MKSTTMNKLKTTLSISCLHFVVYVLIHTLSLTTILKMVQKCAHHRKINHSASDVFTLANGCAKMITLSFFKRPTCLENALMLTFLLIRNHATSQFCLGLAKNGNHLTAHAWVTHDAVVLGAPFNEHLFVQLFPKK